MASATAEDAGAAPSAQEHAAALLEASGLPASFASCQSAKRAKDDRDGGCRKRGRSAARTERHHAALAADVASGVWTRRDVFDEEELRVLEARVDAIVAQSARGELCEKTVDRTALRTKYFFGYGYTYGVQCSGGPECVYPDGMVDPIPAWAARELIAPLRRAGVLPGGAEGNGEGGAEADVWVNSVVVNDYRKDGFISPHIDPPHVRRDPAQTGAATPAAQFIHARDHIWPHSFPRGTGVRAPDRLPLALLGLRARIWLLLLMAAARHPRAEKVAEVAERHLGRPRGASATWRGVRALGCGGGRLGALREAG